MWTIADVSKWLAQIMAVLFILFGGLACSQSTPMDQQIKAAEAVVKTFRDLGVQARVTAEIGGAAYYGLAEVVVVDPGIRVTVMADLDPERAKKLDAILAAIKALKEPEDDPD